MSNQGNLPLIGADDFTRRFSLRTGNLMWLLGAGASASAGIPTAWDMVWEFKQQLFISQRRVSPQSVADLSSSAVRNQLQMHIDSSGQWPKLGDPDEYATLFEAVYPAEIDRRAYLDAKMMGAKPSYGHIALATLMKAQLARIIWTTNFDSLVADGCAKVHGTTGALTTVALDAPDLAEQCMSSGRWPVEVKLHGDFRSRRLKNTPDELRHQDKRLRQVLIDSCRRFGLIVAGYSGRDNSIMDTLEEVLDQDGAFPSGLFWLHRGEDPPYVRVEQLLLRAAAAGIDTGLVRVENFDEALRDLTRLIKDLDTTALDMFAGQRLHWSAAPRLSGGRGWPVVRLNALPLTSIPTVCRVVACNINGYLEARSAVEQADVDVLVAYSKKNILAFGSDSDIRSAFSSYGVTNFGLHTIENKRLRYDSAERGLLREALARSIQNRHGLDIIRRRSTDLLAPTNPGDYKWMPLKKLVGSLSGLIEGSPGLQWREGIGIRLDWANNQLWMLIEPRIVFDGINDSNKAIASDFARERTIKRYNRQLNELINFWSSLIADNGAELRALGIADGVDAVFRISHKTAFSRRT